MLPPEDQYEIEAKALEALRSSDDAPDIRLVDCREEEEFAVCRLEGAELVPLSRFGDEAAAKLLDDDRPIVVYCHHGMRSMQATMFLRRKGCGKVWSLAGGIDRWSERIDPSVPRY
ncbi:MAG: rhodanese-like domain-containing protein [Verrucomicrobiales bacterium]